MTNEATQQTPDNNKRKRRLTTIGLMFVTFGVIVLIYLFYATNFFLLRNVAHSQNLEANYAQLQKNLNTVEQQVVQLTSDLKTQDQVINALRQIQSGYNRDEWRVVEAEFLAKLANDKLQLENNIPQAIILLQSSDHEIADNKDARLLPVRKALADDIAALQAVPTLDISGVYLRLSALNEQISKLPLPNKPAQVEEKPLGVDASLPWWKRGLQETWHELKQVVVVRYNKTGSMPLVMPEQQDFLYQNIHAAMEKAMWALLHQQSDVYHASLDQAMSWIKQYFIPDSPITQSVLTNLTQLQAINVHPSMPKTSESLPAFTEYFVQTNNQPAA